MKRVLFVLLSVFLLTGCSSKEALMQGFSMDASYQIKVDDIS